MTARFDIPLRLWPWACAWLLVLGLTGCAHAPPPERTTGAGPMTGFQWDAHDTKAWQEVKFPGKAPTRYRTVKVAGQGWLRADASRSASLLRQTLDLNVAEHPNLRFEWWVEQGILGANVAERDTEDSPARLILAFEGDRSEFSTKEAALSEMSQLMTGEPLPYATLMYIWCPQRPINSVVHNPRTDRIRKMVVATPASTGRWVVERNIEEDFRRAFGKAPGRLIGIAIMTDSDNTRSQARTLYGPISIR